MRGLAVGCLVPALAGCGRGGGPMPIFPKGLSISLESGGFSPWLGRDLRKLDDVEKEAFGEAFARLTGKEVDFEVHGPRPWSVSAFRSGRTAWILLAGYEGWAVPDISGMTIHRFSDTWRYLGSSTFRTGYRMFLREAEPVTIPSLGVDAVRARTECAGPFGILPDGTRLPLFEQGMYQWQMYVLLDDRAALIRLEDDRHRMARNSYSTEIPMKGPVPPRRTAQEWARSLDSENPCEVLETLVWLTGFHLPSSKPRQENVNQESVEDSRLFEAVRDSPEIPAKLARLAASGNPWIREAARLPLYRPDDE